jgi:hypothetical protein
MPPFATTALHRGSLPGLRPGDNAAAPRATALLGHDRSGPAAVMGVTSGTVSPGNGYSDRMRRRIIHSTGSLI